MLASSQTQKDLYVINRDVTNKLWPNRLGEADEQSLISPRYEGPFITYGFDFHKYRAYSLH